MWDTLWNVLNEPFAIGLLAVGFIALLDYIHSRKPTWEKYTGAVIEAIKAAEKVIPDDTENKSIQRLDAALKYAVKVIEDAENRKLGDREVDDLADGIKQIHADLEANGNLER